MNIASFFKALSDEIRLRILRILLKGSFNVNEILFIIGGRQSNISHHLKILFENGILTNKKEGSQIYYRLNNYWNNEALKQVLSIVKDNLESIPFFNEDIQRLEAIYKKRGRLADEYFNSDKAEQDHGQYELLDKIYQVEEYLSFFTPSCKLLLDVGCGTGRHIKRLSSYGEKIIGVDSSPRMLQLTEHVCQSMELNYQLKLADINSMPFSSNSIDGAFINMVLHHVSDPGSAITETARVLTEGGKLLLIEFLEHSDEKMRDNYADLWLGFPEAQLKAWLNASGVIINREIIKRYEEHSVLIIMGTKE